MTLAYERHGNPDDPTVVLVGSDPATWTAQVAALSPIADVIVVEAGSGSSPAEFADRLLAVLDEFGAGAVHLVGHGSGGASALWIAAHRPDRVCTLTVLCAAAESESARRDLARIVAPTLVIAGAQDTEVPPDAARAVADDIADAEFHLLDPAGHLVHVEQAGKVSVQIRGHLARSGPLGQYRGAAVDTGMRVRRSVLGDAHVDRAMSQATEFTAPFQDFITRTAWGDIWARPGLDHRTRRLLTLAILTAVGNEHELDMHIRAALRAGMEPDELVEVFLHTAVYAGVPNSNRAFALGKQALADVDAQRKQAGQM